MPNVSEDTATVGPTIMIVDDDKVLSHPLTVGLKEAGYQVVVAENGAQALEAVKAGHPQLVLLDYALPDMSGVEVLQQLRADPWGKTVPVIFATNIYELDVVNTVMALGVRDYVLKADINLSEVVALVGNYVPLPTATQVES